MFILGAGMGAILAVLFSPVSGEDVREEIAHTFEEGADEVQRRARQIAK